MKLVIKDAKPTADTCTLWLEEDGDNVILKCSKQDSTQILCRLYEHGSMVTFNNIFFEQITQGAI